MIEVSLIVPNGLDWLLSRILWEMLVYKNQDWNKRYIVSQQYILRYVMLS